MRALLLLSLLWFAFQVNAQVDSIDSLEQLVRKEGKGPRKIQLLNELAFAYFDVDLEKAGASATKALELSRELGDRSGEGWSMAYKALYYFFGGSLGRAKELLSNSLVISRNINAPDLEAYNLTQFGNIYRDRGHFDSAHVYYDRASAMTRAQAMPYYEYVARLNKARLYLIQSLPDSALTEAIAALELYKLAKRKQAPAGTWIVLAGCYQQLFKYKEAGDFLKKVRSAVPGDSVIQSQAGVIEGEMYFSRGDFDSALKLWGQVLNFHRRLNYQYALGNLLFRMGEAFEEQGFYELSTDYLAKALAIADESGYQFLAGEVQYELAWVFYRNSNTTLAQENINKAEAIFRALGSDLRLAGCLNVNGLIQLKKNNLDSSLYFHLRSLAAREKLGNKVALSSSLFNIGELYNKRKEYQKSLPFLWKGVRIDESIGDNYGRSLYYVQLGIAYTHLNKKDSALYYLNNSLKLAVPSSATDILRTGYFAMADYYERLNLPKEAIPYYRKYIQLNDSIFSKQNAQSLAAYRALYEVDTKEREIELLNKDKLLAQAKAERQQTLFYIVMTGLLILLVLTLFYYRFTVRLKKLNQEITEKGKKIEVQSGELELANRSLVDLNNELQASNEQLKLTLNHLHKTQSQLVQSEKMASLGVLSSGIAHELNNPLNFIKGGATALEEVLQKQSGSKSEEASTLLGIIHEGVNRASVILKGLSHYSRQSDQQNETCDLHKIIDNCLVMLSNNLKHRVTVEKEYSAVPSLVQGNEGQLHQAFINILSNAEQAIAGTGTIWIKTSRHNDRVMVSIRDSGSGISEENLTRLGDPFFTTKGPGVGTGLGLSITYQIIERHQGQISVRSAPNQGAEFILSFTQQVYP